MGLGNCHIGEFSRLSIDWPISGASTDASVCTDANKERVHHAVFSMLALSGCCSSASNFIEGALSGFVPMP
jgi:hypothetical protein